MTYSWTVLLQILSCWPRGELYIMGPWETFYFACVCVQPGLQALLQFMLLFAVFWEKKQGRVWGLRLENLSHFSWALLLPLLSQGISPSLHLLKHFLMNLCHHLCSSKEFPSLLKMCWAHISAQEIRWSPSVMPVPRESPTVRNGWKTWFPRLRTSL